MILRVMLQLGIFALFAFGIFWLMRALLRGGKARTGDFSIRRLFQYLILFGSVVISAIGTSGLLSRLFDTGRVIAESRTDLARNLAFVIVGVPLTYGLASWSMRSHRDDPSESRSLAWAGYLTIASITALSTTLSGLHDLLSWLIGNDPFHSSGLSRSIVWGSIWAVHWQIAGKSRYRTSQRLHHLIGSAIGLAILAVGFGGLVGSVLEQAINYRDEISVISLTNPAVNNVITVILGLPVWYMYWLHRSVATQRDFLWNTYVFIAGITAGFITAVVSSSVILYDLLIWFFGDIGTKSAQAHFFQTANAVGSAVAGFAIWWYHRSVLSHELPATVPQKLDSARSEIRRVYEYIITGISLIAASLGLLMILVALVESVTPSDLVAGSGSSNTLILAITLLIVGSPTWWWFWRRIERRSVQDKEELLSPTRRIFLLMLFGVSGVAAVISIITGLFLFLDDLLNNQLGLQTLRDARFALGILVTNGAISGYHWSIYRAEREFKVRMFQRGKYVVLVGPEDGEIAHLVKERIGGHVQLWISPDSYPAGITDAWNLEEVINLVEATSEDEVMILNEKKKLRSIPFHRS